MLPILALKGFRYFTKVESEEGIKLNSNRILNFSLELLKDLFVISLWF